MVEWKYSKSPVPYEDAVALMEARVVDIRAGCAEELVWLLEHPPLYTAGSSAREADLLAAERFPVYQTGRGGQYTYHGPGQRIAYVMLDLKQRAGEGGTPDLRAYVKHLEQWLIDTLAHFGVVGERREGRIGIWTATREGEAKIAALGVRVRRGVSYHGVALNVCPELEHFSGIVPCGIRGYGVTSLAALGKDISMVEIDAQMRRGFEHIFADQTARTYSYSK